MHGPQLCIKQLCGGFIWGNEEKGEELHGCASGPIPQPANGDIPEPNPLLKPWLNPELKLVLNPDIGNPLNWLNPGKCGKTANGEMPDDWKLLNDDGGKPAKGEIPLEWNWLKLGPGNASGPKPDDPVEKLGKPAKGLIPDPIKPPWGILANGFNGLPKPNRGSEHKWSRKGKKPGFPDVPFKLSWPKAALSPANPPNPLKGVVAAPGAIVTLLPAPIFYLIDNFIFL